MNSAPRLIIFDLDGTLAKSKQQVTPKMGALLEQLLLQMPVAVMSGAGFPQFQKQFFPALPPKALLQRLYIFPDNAAQCFIYRSNAWHAQYDQSFTPAEREHILKALNEVLAETGLSEVPVRIWGQRVEDRGAQITFSGLGQHAPLLEKETWDPTGKKRQRLRRALARRLPEFSEATGGLTSIDITRKGVTKAYGVHQLSEIAEVPVVKMLYVGDALEEGGNDEVVKETGIPTRQVAGPEETVELIKSFLG